MTAALHQQIRRTILRHELCPPGSRLLVGVSGGSDSVALTRVLLDLSVHGGFAVVSLAHLNHQLRPAAARDEAFCRAFAASTGVPIAVEAADVRQFAATAALSCEDAARRLRYDFLTRAAAATGADRVAVGHTQDDQAETLLLKLARGAGAGGLGGIYPRRGNIIRPLLDVSRADLRAYLRAIGQDWVEDETNADLSNPRNRMRHILLPELDRTTGGATRPNLARAADLVREDGTWLDALSRQRAEALVSITGEGFEIDGAALQAEPLPVRRRIVRDVLKQAAGTREIGLDHVESVLALLGTHRGGVDLPGSRMELRRGKLVLLRQKGA